MQGSDFLLLFEDILEIGLGGEAEVTADFAETFIRIGQQALGFLQLTAHDERGDFKSKFLLELFGQIGAGLMDGIQKVMRAGGYFGDAAGQFALNLGMTLFGQITYFYTGKVGLAAGAVATVLLLSKIIDAFTDLIMGNIVDHTAPGKQKYRP